MSTINYTYNVIVDRFRQFAAGHFQLRRFTHGEISQADLEKEAEWPWLHVKPRAINYSPGTRSFSFEIFISDLPRDKEDKTGYQAESITDCSLIFQDLINEIYLGNMFGDQVVLSRPVNSEPFVEQYTHTLTGVTGTIELNLDYDWSACSIPASWNYNTPTDSPSDGWGALQFIESLDQNGVFVSLDGDVEAPGNGYYYGTNAIGVKGWYQLIDNVGITCEDLPECATIISIVDDIAALQADMLLKANTADLGAVAFSNDYNDLDNKPTIPDVSGFVPYVGATTDVDLGTYNLTADHLALNVSPSGAGFVVGATQWNNTIGSSETLLKGGSVSLKNGVDLVARVVNKVTPNTTLTKAAYQAVRVSGAQGQRLAVALAQANNDNNSADTIGIVCETIATNQEGFIQTVGQLENINTTGSLQGETWADGDVLYLSPTTAGALTNIKPTGATGHIVVIGYVEYAHANNGKIYVKIMNGWELDELHNVYITSPANNNVLTYESSTSLWKNKTVETALGFTPVPTTRTLTINGTTQDLSANRTFTIATNAGTVTSVAALTLGTTGTDLTSTVANSTSTPVITLNVPTASATNRGALSSTDWSTFNGKFTLPSLTSGSVLFSNGTTIAQSNANLFWDNTNGRLGIGTASPTRTLDVRGIITTQNANVPSFSANGSIFASGSNVSSTAGVLMGVNIPYVTGAYGGHAIGYSNTAEPKWLIGISRNLPQENALIYYENSSAASARLALFPGGNVAIGTTTDAGFKLDVVGSVRTTGSISAASAIARGTFLNQTLVATANSDSLAGLEINPTFTNGAFTGVKNNWINLVGNASVNFTNQLYLKRGDVDVLFASSVETQLKTVSSSSPLKFFVGSTSQYAQFFATTGNLSLQNGGTFTDVASSRLTINSTTQGFLPPRMTTTQKNAIASPATGLMVYDTTLNLISVYNGTIWISL